MYKFSENFYIANNIVLDGNAEATLSDFINNPQTLLLQCVRENEHDLNFYINVSGLIKY